MSELFHSESRADYLYVRVDAEEMTFDIAQSVIQKAAEAAKASGHRRILYESPRTRRRLGVMDMDALAKLMGASLPGMRAAIVVRPEMLTVEASFLSVAAKHSGAVVRYFTGVAEAEHWLLGD